MAMDELFKMSTTTTTTTTSDGDFSHRIQIQGPGKCIKFNQSDPFHIGDKYGGIPLNLLTNTIGWTTLMVRTLTNATLLVFNKT